MKKIALIALAVVVPTVASAQVELISGFNFGQFLFPGYPTVDHVNYVDPTGSIGSNFNQTVSAPFLSGGETVFIEGFLPNFTDGSGRLYWDGQFGSSAFALDGSAINASTEGIVLGVNSDAVNGVDLASHGDGGLYSMRTSANGSLAFVINTTGYTDYSPAAIIEDNFSFAAKANSAPVTISWSVDGVALGDTVVSGNWSRYSVDLPVAFYGGSGNLVAAISGGSGLTFDNVQFNGLLAIPEPSTYAALLGAMVVGFGAIRRRKIAFA